MAAKDSARRSRAFSRNQRGVALLTVLLVLTLMSTLAVYMLEDQYLSVRRAGNQRDAEQAYQLVTGAEQWAARILQRDMQANATDHLNEPWYTLLPEIPVERGSLTSRVDDLQGRFNLNNLAAGRDPVWYPAFRRLLRLLQLDELLADAVVDWIDSDQNTLGIGGAEDPFYLSQEPTYRAGNRFLSDPGELIWVKGFDAEAIAKLAPYVATLPARNVRINVNTAPAAVLRVLGKDGLSESAAAQIISGRDDQGYQNVDEVLRNPALAAQGDAVEPLLTVSSQYFQVFSQAEYGRFSLQLLSTIARLPQSQQVVLLERRRGLL